MYSIEERKEKQAQLEHTVARRNHYTKVLMTCEAELVPDVVEILNVIYKNIFSLKKQLGHLKNKTRKISVQQAMKFRSLYRDAA